ncbi:MAG: hypothetical protein MRY21_05305, partial [Simkaniaceae bacterium]|nr:hypothetical protein [Simkaniaceae bacterium]
GVSSLDDPKLLKLESTLDSLSLPLSRVCSSSPVQVELLSTVRMAALSFVTSLNSLMTSSGLPTFSDSQVTNVKENFSDSAVNNIFNLVDLNSDNYNQNEFAGQAITYVNQTQQVFNQEFYQDNNPLTTQLMSLSQEANNLYDNQGDAGAGLGVDLAAHLLIQFFG